MSDCGENVLETELESLEAIYINELTYSRNTDGTVNQVELLLHPATGHDLTKQYVCMTLVFTLNSTYPDDPPEIEIHNPRGLGEEEISSLIEDMILKAEDMKGDAMLYTLIEMAKDSLTEGNVPHCPCVVCLEHFDNPDNFHRTACYHYFHKHCLYKYLLHTRVQMEEDGKDTSERRHLDVNVCDKNKPKKIICPVCRSSLDEESLAITCSAKMLEDDEKAEGFVIPASLKEQQLKMSQLYDHQKARGGIIDLELERNKYLVNPDERWPIHSIPVTPHVASQDISGKLPREHDSGRRKEDRTKQGSSFQQYRGRSRNSGRGNVHHGRSDPGRHNKDRTSPRPRTVDRTQNWDSHPSGGSARKVKEKAEKVDLRKENEISEGREVSRENESERRQASSDRMSRDHDDSGNGKINRVDREFRERVKGGNSEKNQPEEDSLDKDISGVNLESDNNELQIMKGRSDRAADGYKLSQRGISVRAYDSGRGRGRFEESHGRGRYRMGQDQRYLNLENVVSQIRSGNGGEEGEKNGDGKGKTSLRGGPSGIGERRFDGADFLEHKGSNEKYRSMAQDISCSSKSLENGDLKGASGFNPSSERGINSRLGGGYNDEYKREDSGRQQRMTWSYGNEESSGYRRGGGQRGRGFESGHKGSRFNERRDGHTEQSRQPHNRYDRPHQQRSYQHHQQHHYQHNRQGEERDRSSQPKKDDIENKVTEENILDSGITVRDVHGAGADSETAAQDEEEEADVWKHADTSPWQSSTIGPSLRDTSVNITTNRNTVYLKSLDFNGRSDLYKPHKNNNTSNPSLPESNLERNASYKLNIEYKEKPNFPNFRASKRNHNYIDEKNNLDDQCHLEKSDGYTSNKEFMDTPNCVSYNMNTMNSNNDDSDKENWEDEVNIYSFERYMIRPEHLENYDSQVAPRNKQFTDKLKERCEQREIIDHEFRRIRNEELLRGDNKDVEYNRELLKQEKSILELFKESQAKQSKGTDSSTDDNHGLLNTPDIMSNNLNRFMAKSDCSLKNLEQNISCGYSMLDESRSHNHASDHCHKKFSGSFLCQDVERDLVVGETKNKHGSGISNEHVASGGTINPEPAVTKDYRRQFGHTKTMKSVNCLQGQATKVSGQGQSTDVSGQDLPMKVFYQSQGTKTSSTKDVPRDTFLNSTSSNNALSIKDEYLSSKSESFSSFNSKGSSLPFHMNSPGSLLAESFVSGKMTADTGTLHKDEGDTVPKDGVNAMPQSFKANFKKVPPLTFPKKNPKSTSSNYSLGTVAKATAINEKFLSRETSHCNTNPKDVEQVVGARCNSDMGFFNLYNVPLQTALPMFNAQLSASVSELSAALLSSYETSCLISANLLNNYQNHFGLDPTLLSLNSTHLGSTDNTLLRNLYASNHQGTHQIAAYNSGSSETADSNSQMLACLALGQGPTSSCINNQPTNR